MLRDLLLTLTKASGRTLVEKTVPFDHLLTVRELFLTNAVRGIRWVRSCEGAVFENAETRKLHELMAGHLASKLTK